MTDIRSYQDSLTSLPSTGATIAVVSNVTDRGFCGRQGYIKQKEEGGSHAPTSYKGACSIDGVKGWGILSAIIKAPLTKDNL